MKGKVLYDRTANSLPYLQHKLSLINEEIPLIQQPEPESALLSADRSVSSTSSSQKSSNDSAIVSPSVSVCSIILIV
jgi:hypothetical protein